MSISPAGRLLESVEKATKDGIGVVYPADMIKLIKKMAEACILCSPASSRGCMQCYRP